MPTDPAQQSPAPTVTQTLTPQAQATLEAQQQVERRLAELGLQGVETAERTLSTPFQTGTGELNTVFDLSSLPRAPVNAGTTAQEAIMARLEPQIQRSRAQALQRELDRKSTRLNSSHYQQSRMPSSA